MHPEAALEVMAGAMALLLAQRVIVTDPFFSETEIKKYLRFRQQYHPFFAEAANVVAEHLEEEGDEMLGPVIQGLRIFAENPKNYERSLLGTERILQYLRDRSFMSFPPGSRARFGPLFAVLRKAAEPHIDPRDWKGIWDKLVKFREIPPPLRTLFRKLAKITPNAVPTTSNPGAWFEMRPEERVRIRHEMQKLRQYEERIYEDTPDPEERLQKYRAVAQQLADLQGEAGVNLTIIDQEDLVPISDLIKREKNLVRDGVTEYILQKTLSDLKAYSPLSPRERGKLSTLLQKAKTFSTMIRILQEAADRKLLWKSAAEDFQKTVARAQKNRALALGVPLTPIPFRPMTEEEFMGEHDTGEVRFSGEWTEEEKQNTLGRVSAAIGQLEGIFGRGFAGKHAKKLEFVFEGGPATNCYFAWNRRDRWQPQVTFGKDFDGLLAHELSHFLGDLLGYRVGKQEGLVPDFEFGDVGHGIGDMFGSTGVSLDSWVAHTERLLESGVKNQWTAPVLEFPGFLELMKKVLSLPDYARWSDKLGELEWYIGPAVSRILGRDIHDFNDPDMGRFREARYRSDLPPDVLEEAKRLLVEDRRGDDRKLSYWNSSVEIWARLCEQYVYTKLADAGIANPWLTKMSYDLEEHDAFIDEDTFVAEIFPLMDKIFSQLKERRVLGRLSRIQL